MSKGLITRQDLVRLDKIIGQVEAVITAFLRGVGLVHDQHLPQLLEVMGLADPDKRTGQDESVGARIHRTIIAVFDRLSADRRLLLFVDDLHWIDHASEAVLAAVVASARHSGDGPTRQRPRGYPLLLLCAFRPPYVPPSLVLLNCHRLSVEPLDESESRRLASARLGQAAQLSDLVALVVDKAEGNALFIEELANYMLDAAGDDGSRISAAWQYPQTQPIPINLENLLMRRVDQVDSQASTLLEAASVIGRRFDVKLAAEAAELGNKAGAALSELIRHDLVMVEPEASQRFCRIKHGLIRDTVYSSLIATHKIALHRRVATLLEARYDHPDRDIPELLAHHYGRAGEEEKSANYLYFAGRKSLAVYALETAHAQFSSAMDMLTTNPHLGDEQLIGDVIAGLSRVNFLFGDAASMISEMTPRLHLVERGNDQARYARCCYELGYAHFLATHAADAKAYTERAIDIGRDYQAQDIIGYAYIVMALLKLYFDPPGREQRKYVRDILAKALAISDQIQDRFLGALALNALANQALTDGDPRSQRRYAEELLAYAERYYEPFAEQAGELQLGYLDAFNNNPDSAIERADASLAQNLTPLVRVIVKSMKGGALALKGDGRAAYDMLREARKELIAKQCYFPLIGMDYQLGIALVLIGRINDGVRWIEQSIERFQEWGYPPVFAALGHLMLGELYLGFVIPDPAHKPDPWILLKNIWFVLRTMPLAARKARYHLEKAVTFSRDHDAPAYLAWSLLDLGRLEAAKGDKRVAATLLEEALERADAVDAYETSRKVLLALAELRDETTQPI